PPRDQPRLYHEIFLRCRLSGLVQFHWIARRAPRRQAAVEHPRDITLVTQDARQPGAGFLIGARAVGNDRLVAGKTGQVLEHVGGMPIVVEDLAWRLPNRSRDPP